MGMERYVSRLKSLIHLLLIMCFSNIFEVITMAVSNMRATLLYPIEVVWDTVRPNLKDFSWRSDLKDVRIIDENNFIETTRMELKLILELQNVLNTSHGYLR